MTVMFFWYVPDHGLRYNRYKLKSLMIIQHILPPKLVMIATFRA